MTKIQEAYQTLQAEWVETNDVRVGDKVRVLRAFGQQELGCCALESDYDSTKAHVKVALINDIHPNQIEIKADDIRYSFPFFVLHIVDQPRKVEIEVRTEKHYYRDGVDVTDKISEDTKRNLG